MGCDNKRLNELSKMKCDVLEAADEAEDIWEKLQNEKDAKVLSDSGLAVRENQRLASDAATEIWNELNEMLEKVVRRAQASEEEISEENRVIQELFLILGKVIEAGKTLMEVVNKLYEREMMIRKKLFLWMSRLLKTDPP